MAAIGQGPSAAFRHHSSILRLGVQSAVVFVWLAILICSDVAFSQDGITGGQPIPDDDAILYPVEKEPVLFEDAPDPNSCLSTCQEKCEDMPLDCDFVADNLAVNCENKREECLEACNGVLCECFKTCEEECKVTDSCQGDCLDNCFISNGFNPDGRDIEEMPSLETEGPPPDSV